MSKVKIIPELRFPEFEKDGEWTIKTLAEFSDLESGDGNWILSKDITSNGEFKIVQLSSIGFGLFKEKTLKTISNETFLELNGTPIQKGDLLLNRMVDSNKINSCIFPYDGKYVTSVDVCWIRNNPFFDNYFLLSLICEVSSQNKLLSLSSGAGRVRISKKNLFEKFSFLLPENPKEQQKIAFCLSSLDEVIAAHSQKLNLLKDHKKGLMQNLFPQEGEKVPKYRFKEFENDGEWVETSVEENCLVKGRIGYRGYTTEDIVEQGKGALVLGGKHIQNQLLRLTNPTFLSWEKYYESPEIMVEVGDIIFSQRGTLGDCAIIDKEIGPATINPSMVLLKYITCDARFLYYILIGDGIQNEVRKNRAMGAIPMISQKQIKEFPFLIPKSKEQRKIASCLNSLDALITAQTERIEQLKQHKKGLLQGLFPKINE